MPDAYTILQNQFLEMRWRCLSLAADLDRIERADGGSAMLSSSPQIEKLRRALQVVQTAAGNRAERVQMIFSDTTPPPR